MTLERDALKALENWYGALPVHGPSGGPARGTIGAALVVIDRLMKDYDLDLSSHRASGQGQLRGVSKSAVARVLAQYDETRPFLKEGGRTNRGGPGDIGALLGALAPLRLDKLPKAARNATLNRLQERLVEKVREYHGRKRLRVLFDPAVTVWETIHEILSLAHENNKEGPVAQYLVGAKLTLRFPGIEIRNSSYSTADEPQGLPGDFLVGDTAFHVTVAPMAGVFEKCRANLDAGQRAYLLVPDRRLAGAREAAEDAAQKRISVESVESFVSQNIEELATFQKGSVAEGLRRLLEKYNKRVAAVEDDKSLLIEIPQNL